MINYDWFMSIALEEAERAYKLGEVPVGAVLIDNLNSSIIYKGHNLKEKLKDPTSHAEMNVIREASKLRNDWRLIDTTLFVTLEPCLMCLSAILQSRISRVVFGAYDLKSGSLSKGFHLNNNPEFNHQFEVIGGIRNYQSSQLLSNFFKGRR